MKDGAGKNLRNQRCFRWPSCSPTSPRCHRPAWIEPGLLPAQGILFVGGRTQGRQELVGG